MNVLISIIIILFVVIIQLYKIIIYYRKTLNLLTIDFNKPITSYLKDKFRFNFNIVENTALVKLRTRTNGQRNNIEYEGKLYLNLLDNKVIPLNVLDKKGLSIKKYYQKLKNNIKIIE